MSKASDNAGKGPADLIRLRPKRPCPICSKDSKQKYHPFCSARCADIDLHRWLGEKYTVPAVEAPDFEETAALVHDDSDKDRTD